MIILKNFKKNLVVFVVVISFVFLNSNYVYGFDYSEISDEQEDFISQVDPRLRGSQVNNTLSSGVEVEISAKSGVLMEASTGKILYQKNPHEKMPPASITKIMTLILVMEKLASGEILLTDSVAASEHSSSMGGSQIWLEPGEQMIVDDLIKATAISSANDASVTLAEYIAGSEESFVIMMNQKAEELGMDNTKFMNATGLDAPDHLSTAYDIALMSRELMKHKEILNYTTKWMDSLRGGKTELVNTNRLIRFYKGATGLKTGTTNDAGSCLSATAIRDGMELIAVTMGSETSKDRFNAATNLLDFGFNNFEMYLPEYKEDIAPLRVKGGVKGSVAINIGMQDRGIVIKKGSQKRLEQQLIIQENLQAPVQNNQVVGKVVILLDGETLYEIEVKTAEDVDQMTLFSGFLKLFGSIFKL